MGGMDRFSDGLYGCSEMFINGFLFLIRAGILKREVYPHARVQQLVDAGALLGRDLDAHVLAAVLLDHHAVTGQLLLDQIGLGGG